MVRPPHHVAMCAPQRSGSDGRSRKRDKGLATHAAFQHLHRHARISVTSRLKDATKQGPDLRLRHRSREVLDEQTTRWFPRRVLAESLVCGGLSIRHR